MTTETPVRAGDWMQTYTGRRFWPLDPHPDDVDIVDIAHALSLLCRYNGHVDRFYSVAEHCVLMSSTFGRRDLALWALLHDATEAYVGDMIRPLKQHMPDYVAAEDRVMRAIGARFGLPGWQNAWMPRPVKDADTRILLTERNTLMAATSHDWAMEHLEPLPVVVEGWAPAEAERRYLAAFEALGVSRG